MKNLKLLPLVAMISGVLVGCGGGGGGGGGGGTPVATYTWQVVDLYKVERSKVGTGCAIFANMSDGSGDVIASRVANRDYRILFHNSDGSVVIDKTIEGADLPSSGIITFKESDVPDGGYVALEELDGRSIGQRDSYMFGVHKSLLQNMTLAISSPQTNNSCYKGEQEPVDLNVSNAVIDVLANDNPAYFMTSASNSRVKGALGSKPEGVPVYSGIPSLEKKLVTRFEEYTNDEANNLTQYAIVPLGAVYDATNPTTTPAQKLKGDIVSPSFSTTDLTLSSSGVEVVLSGGVYQWQPLFDSSITYSIAKSELDLSSWSFRLNGTTPDISGSWIYTAQKVADGNDVNISYPNVHDFSTTTIGACGNSYCVNSVGYSPSDFQVQRTAIRSKTDADRDFFQTVYSVPSRSQVILKSPSEQIVPKATDRVEIQVVDSDASLRDKAKFTMALGMNLQNLGTDTTFKDFNGVVMLPSEQLKYKKLMMSQNYQALSNKVN